MQCGHVAILAARPNPLAKIDSTAFKKSLLSANLRCEGCEVRVPKLWICLEPTCRSIVCTTSPHSSHMRQHYYSQHKDSVKDACHCVFLNPKTLTVYCYQCECDLNPFVDDSFMSANSKQFLKSIVRCMQWKKSKQDGDGSIQDLDLPGLVGLKNLGNTCYMNAALQALSNTPALTYYFQTCEAFIPEARRIEYARQKNHTLVDSFFTFITTMWSGKSAIYSPSHFVSDVKKYNEVFQGSAQQDSQEFIRCILDKLHDELTYPRRAEISTLEIPNAYITLLDERPSVNGVNKTKAIPPNASDSPPIGTTKTSKESERSNGSKGSDSGGGSGGGSGGATSSISYTSSRSSTSSRSAISSENSSLTENSTAPEVTPARVTAPSIISDIFEGTLQSRVRCLICRKEYIKEDKFFDLSIPIDKKSKIIDDVPNDMSGGVKDKDSGMFGSFVESIGGWLSMGNRTIKLQDCLASFCATEELTGEDRYRCTNCDALNDCRKTLRVTQLPETLCIHLKRFKYDTYPSKINTFVQFPMEDLDMTPYFKSSDPNELRNAKYDLYAMVRHRGVVGGGHYIGYAKHTMDSQWYEYDDTYVTRKSSADIAKLEAYILFYKRKSTHRDDDRTRISRYLTGPTMQICDKSLLVYISRLWFCRWNFLTNPGPISNRDFLCPHGGINVVGTKNVMELVMPIPKYAWDALVAIHGTDGSPIVNVSTFQSEKMACNACAQEECELNERRRREDDDVTRLDSNIIADGQLWYLIGADWLKEWHAFKAGDRPPGPIRNSQFLKDNGQPRAGMKRGTDYRGINCSVWKYLHGIYGGGPEFVRDSLDLYAPDPRAINGNRSSMSRSTHSRSLSSSQHHLQSLHTPHHHSHRPNHHHHHHHNFQQPIHSSNHTNGSSNGSNGHSKTHQLKQQQSRPHEAHSSSKNEPSKKQHPVYHPNLYQYPNGDDLSGRKRSMESPTALTSAKTAAL